MINEYTGWSGRIRVTTTHKDGSQTVEEFGNLITSAGRNLLRNALDGGVTDLKIKYMGWGNGTTAPSAGDVKLINEVGREPITKQTRGATGVQTSTTYLPFFKANEQIEELGWFAGSTASGTADTGVLVARVLYSKLKTDAESLQVDRVDTIGGV